MAAINAIIFIVLAIATIEGIVMLVTGYRVPYHTDNDKDDLFD